MYIYMTRLKSYFNIFFVLYEENEYCLGPRKEGDRIFTLGHMVRRWCVLECSKKVRAHLLSIYMYQQFYDNPVSQLHI